MAAAGRPRGRWPGSSSTTACATTPGPAGCLQGAWLAHAAAVRRQLADGRQRGRRTGHRRARGGLRPDDKLQVLQQLHKEGRKVLMLGDGVNDVPVLAAADISVAMGSATDLAKTSADAVLLSNRLAGAGLHLARRTRRVIIENLLWAGCTMASCCRSPPSAGSRRCGPRSACRSVR
jgi:hypothetical protein